MVEYDIRQRNKAKRVIESKTGSSKHATTMPQVDIDIILGSGGILGRNVILGEVIVDAMVSAL